ncbi:DNA-binding response regulator, NarL/FixJ family, contains REC and HTH domains [Dyadobacter koreensis]|uniref:DNA-binding response regulator, NarL/FixJ family, contains REC and HTH domains n=1 Tax=Dyadobacter koreensis TaxID=408657 RepID=A0A1H6QDV0_9BACT|nr:response regulator transcription factor [Dyadobacter koreensis]SEI41889.1 DNA-binding response regulator, NarL/FixJ family, contains REC and HTH domains [Dyadobacter koreensis]
MNLLIIDDFTLIRLGIRTIVSELDTSVHFYEADSFPQGLSILEQRQFDMVILDINIPGSENVKMIELIREKQKNIIIFIYSAHDETIYALPFLKAGADGFLSKTARVEDFKLAWKVLLKKRKYASSGVQEMLLNYVGSASYTEDGFKNYGLSVKELQIMQLMSQSKWNKEIAAIMKLKENTVSTYKRRIYEKLNVKDELEFLRKVRLYS